MLRYGTAIYEASLNVLPRGSLAALYKECGGVDETNFLNWALHLVNSVKDITLNERRVLSFMMHTHPICPSVFYSCSKETIS